LRISLPGDRLEKLESADKINSFNVNRLVSLPTKIVSPDSFTWSTGRLLALRKDKIPDSV